MARVAVDVGLAHLDRPFDYLVPASMAEDAQPGVRVRVRFAGRLVDGFVVERAADTEHAGALAPLATGGLARAGAQPRGAPAGPRRSPTATPARWPTCCGWPSRPGTPGSRPSRRRRPRSAGAATGRPDAGRLGPLRRTAPRCSGRAVGRRHRRARSGRRCPARLAGRVARLVAAALAAGRGALVVLPDHRDLARVDAALTELRGPDRHVVLTAEAGPAERYRRWLRGPPRPGARGASAPGRPCSPRSATSAWP